VELVPDDLAGELGADTITGGGDSQNPMAFILAQFEGSDTITDFVVEFDDFVVTAPSFGGQLVAGALLPAAQFTIMA